MTMRHDFTVDAGRDYGLQISLFEADNETPLNLLDCALEWIAAKSSSNRALIAKTNEDPAQIEITDSAGGKITIFIHQTDTDSLGGLTCDPEVMVSRPPTGALLPLMRRLTTIQKS